jgi:hypothetical protein
LFGLENYRDLTTAQQAAVVKSMSKTTVGRSLQSATGREQILGEPTSGSARVTGDTDEAMTALSQHKACPGVCA